jgi:hypothetical protein
MEPITMFWFFVIFAFIGFITDLIWGLDVYKIYSDIGAIIVISVISFMVIGATKNPNSAIDVTEKIVNYFVNQLIPMVIGDAAGTFVSNIVKSFGGR